MAGSGRLGADMADALGLPSSTVMTAIKALRAGRMLNIKGRGQSAAQMTADDAIAIVVGIMSAAVTAEIPKVTRMLLEMPSRHFVRQADGPVEGSTWSELLDPRPHQFSAGLRALFLDETAAAFGSSSQQATENLFNPKYDPGAVSIAVGVNGYRDKGFAMIEAATSDGRPLKNFYGTPETGDPLQPNSDPGGLGLKLYRNPPTFVFAAAIDGRALSAVGRVLAEPGDPRARNSLGRSASEDEPTSR